MKFKINEDSLEKGNIYFMKLIKLRIVDNIGLFSNMIFIEMVKKNYHKLIYFIMKLGEEHDSLKIKVIRKIITYLKKHIPRIDKKSNNKMI